jgi:hypothetical protein
MIHAKIESDSVLDISSVQRVNRRMEGRIRGARIKQGEREEVSSRTCQYFGFTLLNMMSSDSLCGNLSCDNTLARSCVKI